MEVIQKSKVEVWEIVKESVPVFPNNSIAGIFCIIRRKGLIGWGEWYYLHSVLEKCKKGGSGLERNNEQFVDKIIQKLKQNESKINNEGSLHDVEPS